MSDLTKTIKLRIHVTPEQEILFRQMTEQYRQACNFISQYVFDNGFELNSNAIQKVLYKDVRSLFGLKSQLTTSSFKTVTARYKAVKQQLFQNSYRYKDENGNWQRITKTLEWLWKPVFFSRPQADLVRNRDYSFVNDGQTLSINTLGKRTKCTFEGEHFTEYLDGSYFPLFMVGRFDVSIIPLFGELRVILFAFIAGVGNDTGDWKWKCLRKSSRKGSRVVQSEVCDPTVTQVTNPASTPYCTLYAGLTWPFFMASSFRCMKVASISVLA